MLTRADFEALDEGDLLADLLARFHLPAGLIYLDGNSLGPRPLGVKEQVGRTLDQWADHLISGWFDDDWVNLPLRVGSKLERLLGAEPGSVVCTDSTSVNLYKAVGAACDLTGGAIVTDDGNFPTDLYVLAAVANRWNRPLTVVSPDQLQEAITPGVGVLSVTHVDYRTGRRHDLMRLTEMAHHVGALTVWDLSHSAGAMPLDLAKAKIDLAVGCGYKYLNGGPGAPAYIYVSPRWLPEIANPVTGWFGHARPFDFSTSFVGAENIGRMRIGTPDVLSMTALDAALDVWEGVDLDLVRAKSEALTGLFMDLVDQEIGGRVAVLTPRSAGQRGSQVSLQTPDAATLIDRLARRQVIGDFRSPDVARFGFAPLYTRYRDVWEAVAIIKAEL